MPILENAKHEAFAIEYVRNGGNGSAAVVVAGYSGRSSGSAAVQANRLINKPEVAKRIKELQQAAADKAIRESAKPERETVAMRSRRILTYVEDFEALQRLQAARGEEMAVEIAGGGTGLLVRDYKGKDADTPIYRYDSAVIRDKLAIRQQLAQELGEWMDRSEVANITDIESMSPEALDRLYEAYMKRLVAQGDVSEAGATETVPASVDSADIK